MFLLKRKKNQLVAIITASTADLCRTIFKVFLITFIAYFMIEQFKIGVISNYFDLNLLLIFAIISGMVVLFFTKEVGGLPEVKRNIQYRSLSLAIVCGIFIYQQLSQLRGAVLISLMCFLAILIILNINYNNYDTDD